MPKKKTVKTQFDLKRPPVVTMLGHVDHGKTSLLDAIRGTKVQSCEAGGITQTVRAHKIEYKTKQGDTYNLTFIDTPGHEAFSQMRSRGASITDIAVLVVAVDDSVQPQTKEAIKFIQEAKVPIIVALNKIDIQGVDKAKVKRELSQAGVQVEDLGGEVVCIETSATKKTGIDELLEAVLLVAELSQLKSRKVKVGTAEAIVLESTRDTSLGAISLCLVTAGEARVGNYVVWEGHVSKVRAIKTEDFCDNEIAVESDPMWFAGFDIEVPVGTILHFFETLDEAKKMNKQKLKISEEKETEKEKADEAASEPKSEKEGESEEDLDPAILAQLLDGQKDDEKPALNLIVRTDSQGTLEVVLNELASLEIDEVNLNVLESATGDITEDDITKAKDSGGVVIGFRTHLSKRNEKIAKQEKVLVKNYEIIYELLEEVAEVVQSLMLPREEEVVVARAEVKKVFELSNGSIVAGCKVVKGTILKGYRCFVERGQGANVEKVGEGKIVSLKHAKEEVREAPKGTDCGIFIEPQVKVKKDDSIVCFKVERV